MNRAQQKNKKRFVLTMRNQNGQVGIFVALIFQVIFVFFAMLVNVGLVVHHKINLQQSTDLAAYYGAMKQAEIMNVMAHVNYQIRQAWKLMAWRYRVLGTFGIEQDKRGRPDQIIFPIDWYAPAGAVETPRYQPNSKPFVCDNPAYPGSYGITISDIPFMCMGHNGFGDWMSGNVAKETFCKVDCEGLHKAKPFTISKVPSVGTAMVYGNNMGAEVDSAINRANDIVKEVCSKLGSTSAQLLSLYYGNYIKDTQNRKQFIKMLTKNLGLPEDKMLDIEGNSVLDGVKNTLKNNLTEANLNSLTNSSIQTFNGVKSFSGGTSYAEAMMREITFEKLLFFIEDCIFDSDTESKTPVLKPIYAGATNNLDSNIKTNLGSLGDPIEQLFALNSTDVNTIGFEKNPWINVYYGVKATSEPKIPFLPLAKIKLNAISFAKPFGGTIGPWYFKNWEAGQDDNSSRTDWENRTDLNLPRRTLNGLSGTPTLKIARDFIFNYSTHVGDSFNYTRNIIDPENKAGLANTNVVAFYHNMLANKNIFFNSPLPTSEASKEQIDEPRRNQFLKPQQWPKYAEWYHLSKDVTEPDYDPLAVDRSNPSDPRNTYMRDIEITVVTPNQFDATYYSIEPDFSSNYRTKLTDAVVSKIATAASLGTPPVFPNDFGHPGKTNVRGVLPRNPQIFSVRHQMQITYDLFKKAANVFQLNGNSDKSMMFALDTLATKQASLLTSWTFLNLSATGYSSFPKPDEAGPYSMLFGICDEDATKNPWTANYGAPYEENANLPPVPGNCVTGGRTGYSVKLISSDLLSSTVTFENLGGPGMNGSIKNPVPASFLQFSP